MGRTVWGGGAVEQFSLTIFMQLFFSLQQFQLHPFKFAKNTSTMFKLKLRIKYTTSLNILISSSG